MTPIHMMRARKGPLCGGLREGDGSSGLWVNVTCPGCLAKRVSDAERAKLVLRKKKIQRGGDL